MREYILDNGIKLIYIKGTSQLTSICIGLNAGASQDGENLGIAHATEHMIYKGTTTRSEAMINKEFSKIFGFSNAMTNFPYVIYYGTLLDEDFEEGIELFSDLLINPTFPEEGFEEEMAVIHEELKEWDEELDQYCEDRLLFNAFKENRLKYPIIGTAKCLNEITRESIKDFYRTYYSPKNMSIAVVSDLEFEKIKEKVNKYFKSWNGENVVVAEECKEVPKSGVFKELKSDTNTCKVQMNFSIANLNEEELKAFRIFNEHFGQGINSVLFDTLRTKNGLVYDVLTRIAYEKYLKYYKITFSTSKEKVEKAIDQVKIAINNIEAIDNEKIQELIKTIRIKKLFNEEKGIQLAKEISTYSVMFGNYRIYDNSFDFKAMDSIDGEFILKVAKKVLQNPVIEII